MINPKRACILPITLLLALLVVGCNPQQKEMEKRLAGEEFSGIVPCADCEGIAFRLHFYANSRYQSSSMYVGESNETFIEEGSWRAVGDSTIVLKNQEGTEKSFRLDNSRLLMLDRDGKEVQGELASRYILRNTRTEPVEGSLGVREGESNINFKAHGNEPFWGLQIDTDQMIAFRMMSGDSLRIPVPEVKIDSMNGLRTYSTKTESGTLSVTLRPVGCIDSMSGQVYDYRVEVMRDSATYTGCGGFLNNSE